jgi:hypothetical protein
MAFSRFHTLARRWTVMGMGMGRDRSVPGGAEGPDPRYATCSSQGQSGRFQTGMTLG